ncbi:MAG TPA: hypothetical protein VMV77_17705 [Bacteroidales bacterium]|nr:hypothetical protein [Bacteroidales bacterium]
MTSIIEGYEYDIFISYRQKDKTLEIAASMEKYPDSWGYAWGLAEVYAALGDNDKAINSLERVYQLHGDFMPWLEADLYFKPLLNDPRFKEIVQRLNLPD